MGLVKKGFKEIAKVFRKRLTDLVSKQKQFGVSPSEIEDLVDDYKFFKKSNLALQEKISKARWAAQPFKDTDPVKYKLLRKEIVAMEQEAFLEQEVMMHARMFLEKQGVDIEYLAVGAPILTAELISRDESLQPTVVDDLINAADLITDVATGPLDLLAECLVDPGTDKNGKTRSRRLDEILGCAGDKINDLGDKVVRPLQPGLHEMNQAIVNGGIGSFISGP